MERLSGFQMVDTVLHGKEATFVRYGEDRFEWRSIIRPKEPDRSLHIKGFAGCDGFSISLECLKRAFLSFDDEDHDGG